ncbi:MAG: helix-turn-helix domain-containing protein [Burkholderiaceae bacterium]|nr:helix-turn-helix domain-containing protein [Burkholderiaceae bacterium]
MASDPCDPQVKSAVRVLAVLQLFERLRRPVSAKEISASLDMPVSSTSMLLRTMVSQGYLSFDAASRRYLPTLRVVALGHWMVAGESRSTGALIELTRELWQRTGQLVAIGARKGLFAQYIHVMSPVTPAWYEVPNGAVYPLSRSTCGWALLAPCQDDEISRIVLRSNAERVTQPVEPRWILGQMDRVRREGYAFSFGQVRAGSGAVSMRLPKRVGDGMALVIGGNGKSFVAKSDEYISLMREGIDRHFGSAA